MIIVGATDVLAMSTLLADMTINPAIRAALTAYTCDKQLYSSPSVVSDSLIQGPVIYLPCLKRIMLQCDLCS